jgi:hypothetical protein
MELRTKYEFLSTPATGNKVKQQRDVSKWKDVGLFYNGVYSFPKIFAPVSLYCRVVSG